MLIIKEKIENITLFDQPETAEALNLLKQKKKQLLILKIFIYLSILPLIYVNVISIFFIIDASVYFITLMTCLIPIMLSILYIKILKPYKKLYKIAVHNDQIRNDEHLRFKERKRLEELDKQNEPITIKKVNNTLKKLDINDTLTKSLNKEIKKGIKDLPKKPPIKRS